MTTASQVAVLSSSASTPALKDANAGVKVVVRLKIS